MAEYAFDPANLIDDEPAPAPVEETTTPAPAPAQAQPEREPVLEEPGADKLEPVTPRVTKPLSDKFDPESLYEPWMELPKEATPKEDEGTGGFWTQLANASTQAVASTGVTAQMFNDLAGGDQNNAAGQIGKWVQEAATLGPGYQPKIEDFTKIGSFSDASLYVRESLGAGVGSMVAPFLAFITGSAIGTPVVGVTAALATTFSQNAAESYQVLHADPQIQQALAEGKISRQQIAAVATGTGGVMATLDAVGLNKIAKLTGIGGELLGKAAKEVARKTLVRRVLEGGAVEGGTEMAQNIVQEAARMASGGEKDFDEATIRSINALFQGAIPGAAISVKGRSTTKVPSTTGNEGDQTIPAEAADPETAPSQSGPGTGTGAPPSQPAGGGDTQTEDETKPEVKPGVQTHIGTSTPMQERIKELREQNPGWTMGRAFQEAQRERTERERLTPATTPGVDPTLGAAAAATNEASPNEYPTGVSPPGATPAATDMEAQEADELGMTIEEYRAWSAKQQAAPAPAAGVPSPAPGTSSPATPSTAPGLRELPDPTEAIAEDAKREAARREQKATNTEAVQAGLDERAALEASITPAPQPKPVGTAAPASPLGEAPAPTPSPAPGTVEAPAAPPTGQPGTPPIQPRRDAEIDEAWDRAYTPQEAPTFGPSPPGTRDWRPDELEPAPAAVVQEPAPVEAVSPIAEAGVPVTPPAPAREAFAPQLASEPAPAPAPIPARATPKVAALVQKAKGKAEPLMTPRKARETIAGLKQGLAAGKLSPEKRAAQQRRIDELEERYGRKEEPKPETKPEPVTPRVTKAEEKAPSPKAQIVINRNYSWPIWEVYVPDGFYSKLARSFRTAEAAETYVRELEKAGPKGRAVLSLKTKVEAPAAVKEKPKAAIPTKETQKVEAAPRPTEQKKEEVHETVEERRERLRQEEHAHREATAEEAAKAHVEAIEAKRAREKALAEGTIPGQEKQKAKVTAKKVTEGGVTSGMLENRKREDIERMADRIAEKMGENAPAPVKRILELKAARKSVAHGGGKAMQAKRDVFHAKIDKVIADWVADLKAEETAREPTPEEKEAQRQADIEKTTEDLKAGEKSKYVLAEERERAEKEAAAKSYEGENNAAKAAVDQHFAPVFEAMEKSGQWDFDTLKAAVKKAAAAFKGELPNKMERLGAPWMNFLVYATREKPGFVDLFAGYAWVRDGMNEEFYTHTMQPAEFSKINEKQVREAVAEESEEGKKGKEKDLLSEVKGWAEGRISDSAMESVPSDIESWLEANEEPGKGQVITVKDRDGNVIYSHTLREKQSHTAASLMKALPVPARWMESALVRAIDKRVRAELTRLVGNTPVYIVPSHVIDGMRAAGDGSHALGLFIAPTYEQRAAGHRGSILVVDEVARNPTRMAHVLKHEMVHAAVDFAYDTNFKNSREIFNKLHTEVVTTGLLTGMLKKGEYGLTSPKELMAEAISNGRFQEKLARMSASQGLAEGIKGLPMRRGFLTSMWQKFVAQVSKIIGANVYGNAGMSYTEASLTLFGATAQEKAEMAAWAERARGAPTFGRARTNVFIDGQRAGVSEGKTPTFDEAFDEIFDAPLLGERAREIGQQVNEYFDTSGGRSSLRQQRYRYTAFTTDLRNKVSDMLGDTAKPLVDAMNAHLGRDAMRSRLAEAGDKVASKLLDFRDRHQKEANAMEAWFNEATRSGSDTRFDKTDARNRHLAVPGFRNRWQRKENDRLHAAYQKFSPEAKALIDEAVEAYKTMHRETAEETVSTILDAAVKASGGDAGTSITLPTGETVQSVTQWVTTGEIDKPKSQQSTRDKEIHKALGTDSRTGVGGLIKNNPALRTLEGLYVPLMRRGKHVVSAHKDYTLDKNLPKGATSVDENSFIFLNDEAAFNDYIDNTTDQILKITGTKNKHRVYVQNRHVEFFDNKTESQRAARELKGFDVVKESQWLNEDVDKEQNLTILPAQTQAMIRSVRQLTGLSESAKLAAEHAVTQASLQQMAGNRLQHRHMQRTGVRGNAMDMVLAMTDYSNANAMYRANLRTSPQLNAGLKWANEWIRTHPGEQANQLKEIVAEFNNRANSVNRHRDQPWIRIAMNLSFVNYLMSFSYLAMQTGQPFYSTLPDLIAKTKNPATAVAALMAAYGKIGITGLGASTFNDLRKSLTKKRMDGSDHAQAMLNHVKGTPYEELLNVAIDRNVLDKNAGQEMDLRSASRTTGFMGTLETGGDYMARPLRAVTSGIEAVNRAVTAIAAYDVGIKSGMTHAQAIEYGVRMVEDTQGNYSGANAPALWNSPLGKALFQFKKYPLMILNKLGKQVKTFSRDRFKTKEGREAFAGLVSTFLIYAMFSGLSGALPWEVINLALFALKGAGLDLSKDKLHEWVSSQIGKVPAEVIMRGLPRMIGVDISNRISLGSLLTFGQPKGDKPDDIYAYLGKALGGPVLGMLIDATYGGKGPPMPKVVKDVYKAYTSGSEGARSPAGIKQAEPYSVGDSVVKALGFTTAREARRQEPGGIFYEKTREKKAQSDRSDLINAAANADKADFPDAWDDIKDWNKAHKGKERIDRGDIYKRKELHRKQERTEKKKGWIE